MLHLLCHQGPLGIVCFQQDSDHVCLWPGYHLHRQARLLCCREIVVWRIEWRSIFFSDEIRFYLYASDGRTRVRLRPGVRGHQLQLEGTFSVFCSVPYIAQIANPVLLSYLRQ